MLQTGGLYTSENAGETSKLSVVKKELILSAYGSNFGRENRGVDGLFLITGVRSWFNRKHGEVDYYIPQLLSGHGYFQSYLLTIGKYGPRLHSLQGCDG